MSCDRIWGIRECDRVQRGVSHIAFYDRYNDEDVRIAIYLLSPWETPALLLELETIILRATEPPYNVQIPPEK